MSTEDPTDGFATVLIDRPDVFRSALIERFLALCTEVDDAVRRYEAEPGANIDDVLRYGEEDGPHPRLVRPARRRSGPPR